MLINFDNFEESAVPSISNRNGAVKAKMYIEQSKKIYMSRIPAGESTGTHVHTSSSEINYVISGTGKVICNDTTEELVPGLCHYCTKGMTHNIINTGNDDLVLFTIITEH